LATLKPGACNVEAVEEAFMIVRRNRRKQTVSFDDRLKTAAKEARLVAQTMPQGAQREDLLKKARQAEAARRINGWLMSRGPTPPL
jgi:hypothetical protein